MSWNPWARNKSLARIESKLDIIITNQEKIMADLSQLQSDVAAQNTVVQSVVTLLQGLKAKLDAAGTDPVALKALSDQLEANTKALSDAVTANTPTPA